MTVLVVGIVKKAIAIAVAFYCVALLGLYLLQDQLLFPAPGVSNAELLPGVEVVEQKINEALVLRHLRLRADPDSPKLLYFHGNGDAAQFSQQLGFLVQQAGFEVLLVEYRGYGGNNGKPTADALLSDALLTYDWFTSGRGADVYLLGHSLGTGIASHVAAHRPVKALGLISAYSSLVDVAAYHYPFFPVRMLFRNHVRSSDYLAGSSAPVIMMHGTEDQVIPIGFGKTLYESAKSSTKSWYTLDGVGHNDILSVQNVRQILDFFKSL